MFILIEYILYRYINIVVFHFCLCSLFTAPDRCEGEGDVDTDTRQNVQIGSLLFLLLRALSRGEVVVVEVVVEVLDTGVDRTRSILWPGDCSQSAGTVSSTSGLIISPAGEMLEEAGRRVSVTNLSSRESCMFPE